MGLHIDCKIETTQNHLLSRLLFKKLLLPELIVVIIALICPKVIPLFSKIPLIYRLSCKPLLIPLLGGIVYGIWR